MDEKNRARPIQLIVRVSEKEKDLIYQKMALLKTENLSAYIRKMAIDGYVINVDYTEVKNHAAQLQYFQKRLSIVSCGIGVSFLRLQNSTCFYLSILIFLLDILKISIYNYIVNNINSVNM